ncbi:MAG: dihydroorotase [Deltaproteobacteria bacterium]|jgi:dihydroorotase|nr:dihydroorotase [Deltaproteobacteria bacterium]MBT4528123.1 dihydroorotase [Deltaproteobacteria bacterium]
MTEFITLRKPDDFHLHVRDDEVLKCVLPHVARYFKRAMIMPNLSPPVSNIEMALDYKRRIGDAVQNLDFNPKMTLYLTPFTKPEDIKAARNEDSVIAMKYYPAGATTNSEYGVRDIYQCRKVLDEMQKIGLPLSIHGEIVDPDIDVFDREQVFVDTILSKLVADFPQLKIILEHVSTIEGVQFVEETGDNVAATITAHHMLLNRNHMLLNGIKSYLFCFPILKSEKHRKAVLKAAVSGNKKFFLGTDSAPHEIAKKTGLVNAGGIYSSFNALPIYIELFKQQNALEKFEAFSSQFGADFYRLDHNEERIKLERQQVEIPEVLTINQLQLIPLKSGETINWRLVDSETEFSVP